MSDMSDADRRRPRSPSDDFPSGWALEPASSTIDDSATGKWMSTTVGFRAISGWSRRGRRPHRLPSDESSGRVSTVDVHNAGCGGGGGESGEGIASVEAGGTVVAMEGQALTQRGGIRTTTPAARARAHRCFLYQPVRPFYDLCSMPDGRSRSIVRWDLWESMKGSEIELILERAKEIYPEGEPRIISDNGPQFIAHDFKEFIRISGMTGVNRYSSLSLLRCCRGSRRVKQSNSFL
jgi:transposase InsO family protein